MEKTRDDRAHDRQCPSGPGLALALASRRGRGAGDLPVGVTPTVAFNIDAFGHPATLPDILAPLGYDAYVLGRPSQHQVPLPAPTFRGRGSGGGELMAFRITPTYVTRTDDLYGQIMLAVEAAWTWPHDRPHRWE